MRYKNCHHNALALLAMLAFASIVARAQPTQPKPESLGFSSERLTRLHEAMQRPVDEKRLAGVVTLLTRHGKLVEERSYGVKDLASGAPMTNDTIFRIYSMTKPVTGVAMMILYEEGKWHPTDPISKFIPEFAGLKVFKGMDANGEPATEPPIHPPTMAELLTHTAGFTYGVFGSTPIDRLYMAKNWLGATSLHDMMQRFASIPLLYQPGSKWVYSVSMDIQGYIIEKISGKPLPEFMEERIFKPLHMTDTGFFVPKEKRARFATLYSGGPDGTLVATGQAFGSKADYASMPGAPSGGGGLVSTAKDYSRFAQMLLNHGELDGARIISPATVDLMTSNHLAPKLMTGEFSIGKAVMRPGHGWGYDLAVFNDPATADEVVGKGTFYWEGAAATWFWIDPANDLVFVGMTQRMYGDGQPPMNHFSRPTVYGALIDPKK
ncbi:MAG TPA: serine hydrolase domain-containing protein [Candidatus Solibacter sp.]|nr:serine hydrolase domain-containing protein [Candidatus Solibacter sp.]